MFHHRWQRILSVGALLLTTVLPLGVVLAAPAAGASYNAALAPSCLQTLKEGLGTVLPGAWSENGPTYQNLKEDLGTVLPSGWSENGPTECLRVASTNAGLIPVTGGLGNSVVWLDAGASRGVSAAFSTSGGWRDAGAGSR